MNIVCFAVDRDISNSLTTSNETSKYLVATFHGIVTCFLFVFPCVF